MTNTTVELGQQAELIAKNYLQQQGLHFVTANYHCRRGEIDLIMQDNNQVVFVEVKYRNCNNFGSAVEMIPKTKQQKIIFTAQHFLHRHNITEKVSSRFDIVSIDNKITNDASKDHQITWLKNAFD